MNITSNTKYFIFNHDTTCKVVNIDEYAATPNETRNGKLKVAIVRFYFDELIVYFANGKIIACATTIRKTTGYKTDGYRVSANAAGFGNFNGLIWKQLGLIHLKTMDREELNRHVYGEIAKLALARMERQLLGKKDD